MIDIKKKVDCCGCEACAQICPRKCIALHSDAEGFLYPRVDASLCIDCHLCEKNCPIINAPTSEHIPLECFAAKNIDSDIRRTSSSGGVFTQLAEKTIAEGGVVFGARFDDNWDVVHSSAESMDELAAFRGSKYVQSHIGDALKHAAKLLRDGRLVLFSGTPCQIAGLKRYLGKEYPNLITVDFICHGVPSPGVFKQYLEEKIGSGKAQILDIQFRDKSKGWAKYSLCISYLRKGRNRRYIRSVDRDSYLIGFVKDLYLRPSCYDCRFKNLKSGSDITMGDFWGISSLQPEFNDDQGISAIMLNTSKGVEVFKSLDTEKIQVKYTDVLSRNPAISHSARFTDKRRMFFSDQHGTIKQRVHKLIRRPLKTRIKHLLEDLIVFFIGESAFQRLKHARNRL